MNKITDERDPNKEAFEETGISLEDVLADQDLEENKNEIPKFIDNNITLEEPLTYARDTEKPILLSDKEILDLDLSELHIKRSK